MPNNNKKTQKRKKSRPSKRNEITFAPRTGTVGVSSATLPQTLNMKFRYSDSAFITEAAAGSGASWVFRADLYDPDYSASGHQPLYFDQFISSAGPYRYYNVLKAKFNISFCNGTGNPALVTVGVAPGTEVPTPPSSRSLAVERPNTWYRQLAASGTGGAMCKHTVSIDCPTVAGISVPAFYTASLGSYAGSAPSTPFVMIQVWAPGGVASVASVSVIVEAEFTARLFLIGPETAS